MNQNKNTPCYIHNDLGINVGQQNHSLSIFNFQQSSDEILEQNRHLRKQLFSNFIASREQYLDDLKEIGDDWISGSSKQPSDESIEISKKFLNEIGSWYAYSGYEDYVYPKIIMGPIPSGGISMKIELFPNLNAYFSIFGDNINYEVEQNGFFTEFEANSDNISYQLLTLYKRDERGNYSKQ